MANKECAKCIHKEVCKTAETCDGYAPWCKHFLSRIECKPVKEKAPTDLTGKCGSCAYAKAEPNKFGSANCYVRCTNPVHLAKYCHRIDKSLRQRTVKACKQYKPKEGAEDGN